MMRRLPILAAFSLATASLPASNWSGGTGNWDSDASPGWNGTGVPNAPGAIANGSGGNFSVTQNIGGGVTVGSITRTGSASGSWVITPANGITLDQDGAGAGSALIENSNSNPGSSLSIGAGALTLADDLVISNSGASANANGAIVISSAIGGSGNVSFRNVSTALTQAGSLRITTATNTFTGAVRVEKGTVTHNTARAFGDAANVITLGAAGQGKAALLSNAAVVVPNAIIVAADAGDTLTLGALGAADAGYSGTVTLDGDLTITSAVTNANGLDFSNVISGAGGLTKAGAGILTLSAANTFTGKTTLGAGAGTVLLKHADALSKSTLDHTGSSLVFDSTVASKTFTFGGLTGSADIVLQNNAGSPAAIALKIGHNDENTAPYGGNLSGAGRLEKVGTGATTLSGTNTYTGLTTVSAGILTALKRASLYNANPLVWNETNIAVAPGATFALGVGDGDGFSSSDLDHLAALGTATGGFRDGAILGVDTTAGDFSYDGAIQNPNGGANALGLAKLGDNKLTLGAISTFTGPTIVHQGNLVLEAGGKFTGNGDITIKEDATFTLESTETLALGTSHIYLEEGTFAIDTIGAVDLDNPISGHGYFSVREGATVNYSGDSADFNGTFDLAGGSVFVPSGAADFSTATFILTPGTTLDLSAFGDIAIGRLEGSGILKGNNISIHDMSGYDSSNFDTSGVTGTITAIPEPSTYAAGTAILLGASIFLRRRTRA